MSTSITSTTPGHHGQLLLEEVAGDGDAVPHEDFVGRAANAGQVDALGPLGLGLGQQFRVPRAAATITSDSVGSCP